MYGQLLTAGQFLCHNRRNCCHRLPYIPSKQAVRSRNVIASHGRRARERAQRKAEILEAARAVFAQGGFRHTTVEAVAERAEVGKGTIYLYFESKDAIRAELLLEALAELTGQLRAAADRCSMLHPEQKLRAMAHAYLAFAENMPDYFRLLNAYDRGDFEHGISSERKELLLQASNRAFDLVAQAIADGMALDLFVPDDPRKTAAVLWAALNGALALMAHPIRRTMLPGTDGQGLCEATIELFLSGIAAPHGDAAN
jgi:AcrR family transcriptional regulator